MDMEDNFSISSDEEAEPRFGNILEGNPEPKQKFSSKAIVVEVKKEESKHITLTESDSSDQSDEETKEEEKKALENFRPPAFAPLDLGPPRDTNLRRKTALQLPN